MYYVHSSNWCVCVCIYAVLLLHLFCWLFFCSCSLLYNPCFCSFYVVKIKHENNWQEKLTKEDYKEERAQQKQNPKTRETHRERERKNVESTTNNSSTTKQTAIKENFQLQIQINRITSNGIDLIISEQMTFVVGFIVIVDHFVCFPVFITCICCSFHLSLLFSAFSLPLSLAFLAWFGRFFPSSLLLYICIYFIVSHDHHHYYWTPS